jgi:serine/threonine protein kinase
MENAIGSPQGSFFLDGSLLDITPLESTEINESTLFPVIEKYEPREQVDNVRGKEIRAMITLCLATIKDSYFALEEVAGEATFRLQCASIRASCFRITDILDVFFSCEWSEVSDEMLREHQQRMTDIKNLICDIFHPFLKEVYVLYQTDTKHSRNSILKKTKKFHSHLDHISKEMAQVGSIIEPLIDESIEASTLHQIPFNELLLQERVEPIENTRKLYRGICENEQVLIVSVPQTNWHRSEGALLTSLGAERPQHILNFRGYSVSGELVFLIYENAPKDSLHLALEKLIRPKVIKLDFMVKFEMIRQILSALDTVHEKGYRFNCLSSKNVQLFSLDEHETSKIKLKLYEYNIPRIEQKRSPLRGSIRRASPESLLYNAWSKESDVYAVGVLMWELLSDGDEPWPNMTAQNIKLSMYRGVELPCPKNCPHFIYDLLIRPCLNLDPYSRATVWYLMGKIDEIEFLYQSAFLVMPSKVMSKAGTLLENELRIVMEEINRDITLPENEDLVNMSMNLKRDEEKLKSGLAVKDSNAQLTHLALHGGEEESLDSSSFGKTSSSSLASSTAISSSAVSSTDISSSVASSSYVAKRTN